jgi:hypothetical protein
MLLTIENLENDLNAKFLIFNFFFWRNFANREKVVFGNPKKIQHFWIWWKKMCQKLSEIAIIRQ